MPLSDPGMDLVIPDHYPAIERVLGHLRARLNIPSPFELSPDVGEGIDYSGESENLCPGRGLDRMSATQFGDRTFVIDFNGRTTAQSPSPRPQKDSEAATVPHFSSVSETRILDVSTRDIGGICGDETFESPSQYSHQEKIASVRKLAKEITPGSKHIYFIAKQLALLSSKESMEIR